MEVVTEKVCTGCGAVKPLEGFSRSASGRYGRHTRCLVCRRQENRRKYHEWTPQERTLHRARVLKCRYGLSLDQLRAMYVRQNGCCAICGAGGECPAPSEKTELKGSTLCVDHDHETGEVRGLLCRPCNLGIGYFSDDVKRMLRAMSYLTKRER